MTGGISYSVCSIGVLGAEPASRGSRFLAPLACNALDASAHGRLERGQELDPVRRAPSGAGVPAWSRLELAVEQPVGVVVAAGDVAQRAGGSDRGIEQCVEI